MHFEISSKNLNLRVFMIIHILQQNLCNHYNLYFQLSLHRKFEQMMNELLLSTLEITFFVLLNYVELERK
jgi:hypothetical protein